MGLVVEPYDWALHVWACDFLWTYSAQATGAASIATDDPELFLASMIRKHVFNPVS